MANWEISGETGKIFDATKRSFDYLGITNPIVSFISLSDDKLVFRQIFASPSEASGMELAQKVTLWRDGVRFIEGNITARKSRDTEGGGFQVDTTIKGPYWWMDQTPLSGGILDGAGNTVERMQFTFLTGDLKTHLTTLINRFITLGCPIQLGTISTCFNIPKISLPNMSCTEALGELLRWVPDAAAWFDYSITTGTGLPALNITRRGDAPTLSLAAGAAPLAGADISPRLDLEVDQVRILFANINSSQETEFVELSSGHSGTAQSGGSSVITLAASASSSDGAYGSLDVVIDSGTGIGQTRTISAYNGTTKAATVSASWTTNPDATSVYTVGTGSSSAATPSRQIVPISGPEISDILPKDYFESETVKTDTIGYAAQLFLDLDPLLLQTKDDHGSFLMYVGTDISVNNNTVYNAKVSPAEIRLETGETLPSGLDFYMIKGEARPWFKNSGIVAKRCVARSTLYFRINCPFTTTDPYTLMSAAQLSLANHMESHTVSGSAVEHGYNKVVWFFYESTVNFWAVDQNWSTETTIYRAQDYEFINPPTDLAVNLQAAQNWVPFEGSIRLRSPQVGSQNILGKKINISNSLAEHASMGALPSEIEIDINGLAETIYVGAPARISYKGLVGRFRQSGRDNTIYI
mgnify:CR=1 FL=1